MAIREVRTFCRVCEPACGLVATVEDGALTRLGPDREHPVTAGFACHKGLAGLDIHRDPDRLDHPLARSEDGSFAPLSWDGAIAGIGERLRAILDESGPGAVSSYVGNPAGFNTLAGPAVRAFLAQLGVTRTFGSGTQDCANKFTASEAVFGSSTIHPIPDLEHTEFLLVLGENPAVSHMSFLSIADPMAVLRRAKTRGATIRFVDPRRSESSVPSVGETILIRPDTDLYLLAALLCEIERSVGFRPEAMAQGRRGEELTRFVRRYPPERVAGVTGIAAAEIRQLASDFAAAPAAAVHMSTGVNMGRQGTLAYWLVQMLALVTGNLDRRGGNVLSEGFYLNAKAGRRKFEDGFRDTEHGRLRTGNLPGVLMAETLADREQPIRALFVVAGNPILSIAGEEQLRQAFRQLDLLVTVDLYRNATGELAHYLLPATDMFERPDVNLTGLGLQHRPWVQWTDAVVAPQKERRPEWWIFARLSQELGLPSVLDTGNGDPEETLWGRIDHMLGTRGHSLQELRALPHATFVFDDHQPGDFFRRHLQTEDRKVDCCPPAFADALERAETLFAELEADASSLSLITRRDIYGHNSWYANVERLRPPHHDRTFLYMHPRDAEARDLAEGDAVEVRSAHGAIEVELRLDDRLKPGVVAVPHGWGNKETPGMRIARRTPGANVNRLLPSGAASFEPLSSQAHMTGIPVEVVPA